MFSWSFLLITVTLPQGSSPTPVIDASGAVTAFVNVSVIPMDREQVLRRRTVVIQGDRIVAMGPAKQVRVPDNAVRIDGGGKFLMPGLADMHMHLAMGVDSVQAERRLFLLLANGVTTIRNLDYLDWQQGLTGKDLLRLRADVAAGKLLGPRIYTAGRWYADTTKSIAQNVEAYKAAGYDLIKVHHDFGWQREQMERTLLTRAPQQTAQERYAYLKLDSLAEAARRVGVPIAGHPVGGLAWALRQRFASVEHLEGFPGGFPPVKDIVLADTSKFQAIVAATRQAGVAVTPTLAIVEGGFMNFYQDSTAVGLKVLHRLVLALQDAGVKLLLGTDSPILEPGKGVHEELNALVRAGLTPYQALVTGTRNVAAYFGTLDSTGTVAVGKRADLVLLTDNPLTDIRHAGQIAGVMAAGRWLPSADIERRLADFAKD